jgi:hypothetical protein
LWLKGHMPEAGALASESTYKVAAEYSEAAHEKRTKDTDNFRHGGAWSG